MAIVDIGHAQAQLLHTRKGLAYGQMEIHPGLIEVDAHAALFFLAVLLTFRMGFALIVVCFFVVMGMTAGQAVLGLKTLQGDPHLHPIANPVHAARKGLRIQGGVRQRAPLELAKIEHLAGFRRFRRLLGNHRCRFRGPGDLKIVRVPQHPIEVHLPRALGAVEAQKRRALVGHVTAAHFPAQGIAIFASLLGQPSRHRVHHPADGARAIEHGGRPLQNFDLIGEERLHGHGVIAAGARGIQNPNPVL